MFAATWAGKSTALYAEVSRIINAKSDPEKMALAELDVFIEQMTQLQKDKQALLSAYNGLPISELEKLAVENPVIDLEPGVPLSPVMSP